MNTLAPSSTPIETRSEVAVPAVRAEGKMVEDRVEVDQLGMMQQLGIILSPEEQAQA